MNRADVEFVVEPVVLTSRNLARGVYGYDGSAASDPRTLAWALVELAQAALNASTQLVAHGVEPEHPSLLAWERREVQDELDAQRARAEERTQRRLDRRFGEAPETPRMAA